MKFRTLREWEEAMNKDKENILAWTMGLNTSIYNTEKSWFQRNFINIFMYGMWSSLLLFGIIFRNEYLLIMVGLFFVPKILFWIYYKIKGLFLKTFKRLKNANP